MNHPPPQHLVPPPQPPTSPPPSHEPALPAPPAHAHASTSSSRGYFRELHRLWRGRRDNPVWLCATPWRRKPMHRFLLAVVIAAYFIALFMVLLANQPNYDNILAFSFLSLAAIPFLFLFFAYDRRSQHQLVDLHLSSLSPREIAFGALCWPSLFSFILVVLAVAILCLFRLFHKHAMPLSISVGLALFFGLSLTFRAAQAWLRAHKHPWVFLLTAPALVGFDFIRLMLAALAMLALLDRLGADEEKVVIYPLTVVGILLMCLIAREAGRHAGAAYFAPLMPDNWARCHWPAREAATLRLPPRLRPGAAQLRQLWRKHLLADFIIVFSAMALGSLLAIVTPTRTYSPKSPWIIQTLSAYVVSLVCIYLWRARQCQSANLPLVSGRILASLMRYALIPTLLFGALASILIWNGMHDEFGSQKWLSFLVMLLFLLVYVAFPAWLLIMAVGALLVPARRRRFAAVFLFLLPALAAMLLSPLLSPRRQEYFAFALIFYCVIFSTWAFEPALERLHALTQRNVQAGRLTSDPQARSPIEILPP